MRFFHLGDLHFGKLVHNVPMADKDQPFWVERFLEKVDEYQPQAVLISGDVYDRKVPGVEAVTLFDHMLTELVKRNVTVLVIAGNHDSGVRLSFAQELLCENKVYIAGEIHKNLKKVTLEDEYGEVCFTLMPYLYPKAVADASVLDQKEIDSYDQAVRELLKVQDLNEKIRNVILVHQNVLANGEKPEHSDSETIVGGLGEIDASAFDGYEYTAMGHIHNAQKMGRDSVRYAGCPLYYDFSECGRDKSLTMVELGAKGEAAQITRIPIKLLHGMKRIQGTLEEICEIGKCMEDAENYYIQAILEDTFLPAHTMDTLRAVFGERLLNVVRKPKNKQEVLTGETSANAEGSEIPMNQLFAEFYQKQNGELMDDDLNAILLRIMDQQERSGGELVTAFDKVDPEDTQEIIDFLMKDVEVPE